MSAAHAKPKITENFTEFQKELGTFAFSTQILKLGTLLKTYVIRYPRENVSKIRYTHENVSKIRYTHA